MDPVTRRSFFVKGTVAAAGVAGATAFAGLPALGAEPDLDEDEINTAEPVLLDIVDVAKGELELLVGEKSILFTDKKLVARIVRASR